MKPLCYQVVYIFGPRTKDNTERIILDDQKGAATLGRCLQYVCTQSLLFWMLPFYQCVLMTTSAFYSNQSNRFLLDASSLLVCFALYQSNIILFNLYSVRRISIIVYTPSVYKYKGLRDSKFIWVLSIFFAYIISYHLKHTFSPRCP